jgi:hypothetical protein
MHIDVTSKIQTCFDNYKPFAKKKQPYITIGIELEDKNEQNISHISITAVVEKDTNEVHYMYTYSHYLEKPYRHINQHTYSLFNNSTSNLQLNA